MPIKAERVQRGRWFMWSGRPVEVLERRDLGQAFGDDATWVSFLVREHEASEPFPTRPYRSDVRLHVVPTEVARQVASERREGAVAC